MMRAQDQSSNIYKQAVEDQERMFNAADIGSKGWLNREEWGCRGPRPLWLKVPCFIKAPHGYYVPISLVFFK